MLLDLEILNGNLELEYNELTYEYTVKVDESVDHLDFVYHICDECFINIRDNFLSNENGVVSIEVFNSNNLSNTYTFYVSREMSNATSGIENYKKSLEILSDNNPNILNIQFLSIGVFLSIIIIFSVIFRRKKI